MSRFRSSAAACSASQAAPAPARQPCCVALPGRSSWAKAPLSATASSCSCSSSPRRSSLPRPWGRRSVSGLATRGFPSPRRPNGSRGPSGFWALTRRRCWEETPCAARVARSAASRSRAWSPCGPPTCCSTSRRRASTPRRRRAWPAWSVSWRRAGWAWPWSRTTWSFSPRARTTRRCSRAERSSCAARGEKCSATRPR